MVTYKLEPPVSDAFGQWTIRAVYRNQLDWIVGLYRDKRRALERLERLYIMADAQDVVSC